MTMKRSLIGWILAYAVVLGSFIAISVAGSRAISAFYESDYVPARRCIVVDAGHGGVDGGTTSCTGVTESNINLEIAMRLNDILHLVGIETKMIRTTDCSVYTSGETIAAKKVSDLKERVRIVESTENSLLVSIHQNYFAQSIYSGAQVFYGTNEDSLLLAKALQADLITYLNPGSKRAAKKATGVYLMEHVTCPAILVECGFLSNPEEEAKLRSEDYQKKLSCVIAATLSNALNN